MLSGLLQNDLILEEVVRLVDRVQTESKVQRYFDFAQHISAGQPQGLKTAFQGEVFTPNIIILNETKSQLLSEINQAISAHQQALVQTEEDLEFDYSPLRVTLPEENDFKQYSGYYIDVLIGKPEELRRVDLVALNKGLLEKLQETHLSDKYGYHLKILTIFMLELQGGLIDQQEAAELFKWVVSCKI